MLISLTCIGGQRELFYHGIGTYNIRYGDEEIYQQYRVFSCMSVNFSHLYSLKAQMSFEVQHVTV